MKGIRVLHVDDEPDIRAVVDLSLTLDPEFEVQSCASGAEALVVAGLEVTGHRARVGELVIVPRVLEANGERFDGTRVRLAHERHDAAGVHPAAEEHPQRDVTHQMTFNCTP